MIIRTNRPKRVFIVQSNLNIKVCCTSNFSATSCPLSCREIDRGIQSLNSDRPGTCPKSCSTCCRDVDSVNTRRTRYTAGFWLVSISSRRAFFYYFSHLRYTASLDVPPRFAVSRTRRYIGVRSHYLSNFRECRTFFRR